MSGHKATGSGLCTLCDRLSTRQQGQPARRYSGPVSAGRTAAALLSGLVAIVALGLAADPPEIAGVPRLASGALFGSLAMAGLAFAGALLQQARAGTALGLGPGTQGPLRTAGLVVGILGLSQLLSIALVESGLSQHSALLELDRSISNAAGTDYVALLIALAIAPGIAEEIFFRGLILRSLAGVFGSAVALLCSSVLFGLVHLDLAQGGAAAILGLYLGAVALRGGGVRACIVCHIANNFAAVAWLAIPSAAATGTAVGEFGDLIGSGVVLTGSAAAFGVGLLALRAPPCRNP